MPLPKDPEKCKAYCQKMSEIAKAKGYGKWMKGKKPSAETLAKRSQSLKKTYGTPERRKEMSEIAKAKGYGKWMKGKKLPHISESNVRTRKGKTYKQLYGPRAIEERKKRRDSNRKRWEGTEREPQREKHASDARYVRWRNRVFRRDGYTCQRCNVKGGELQAHHIKQWALFPSLRYVTSNGITYCKECHKIVDTENGNRKRKR